MTTLKTITIPIFIGLLSCNNYRTETDTNSQNAKVNSITNDTALKSEQNSTVVISDTIKKIIVDDYPITNAMLLRQSEHNPYFEIKSGKSISHDKAWFGNDTIMQTLVFELYTDYHRLVTYHFLNNDIPTDLINRMELHIEGGELASDKQKLKEFGGFLKQTTKINSPFFITDKGFRLGDTKQKVVRTYGNPDKQAITDGIEKLEWSFIGDAFYDGKTDLKGQPLADNSFGHQVIMYFRNEKLIGQILFNDIP